MGKPRRAVRVDVGDEGGAGHVLELGGESGGEREDVGNDRVGAQLAHQRLRVDGGVDHRLVEVERLRPGGEHLVLGGGGERETLGLDVVAPARPRLQRHLVAAGAQGAAEGDHREGVARIAERAEQQAQGLPRCGLHANALRRRARRAAAAARGARRR